MSYGDSDLFDISDAALQIYQLPVYHLLVRLLVVDYMMYPEFIAVISLSVIGETVVGDHKICTPELYELAEICTSYQLASY